MAIALISLFLVDQSPDYFTTLAIICRPWYRQQLPHTERPARVKCSAVPSRYQGNKGGQGDSSPEWSHMGWVVGYVTDSSYTLSSVCSPFHCRQRNTSAQSAHRSQAAVSGGALWVWSSPQPGTVCSLRRPYWSVAFERQDLHAIWMYFLSTQVLLVWFCNLCYFRDSDKVVDSNWLNVSQLGYYYESSMCACVLP